MTSKDVHLRKLSEDTGISVSDLKKILDGTYRPERPYFIPTRPTTIFDQVSAGNSQNPVLAYEKPRTQSFEDHYNDEPEETDLQRIAETDDPEELFGILEELDYTDGEFVIAYEKLARNLAKAMNATDDLDTLDNLLSYCPTGSPEETAVIQKIKQLEAQIINSTKDFDELVSLYQDNNYRTESMRYLGKQLISVCTSPAQTHELIRDVFPESTLEYYLVQQKHQELITRAINDIRSLNDINDLDEYINSEDDANVFLAQKIVSLCGRDPEKIWEHHEMFSNGSEAQEILAQAAINYCTTYDDTANDVLDAILESFENDSRIGRLATKHQGRLLGQFLQNTNDVSVLNDHLEDLEEGSMLKKQLEERIVQLTNSKDDLHDMVDTDTYIGNLAQDKLSQLLQQEQSRARSAQEIANLYNYVESDSVDDDRLDLRLAQLVTSESEMRNYQVSDASFAMYQLAKRFAPKITNSNQPVVAPPVVEKPIETQPVSEVNPVEEERKRNELLNELRLQDEETKRRISKYSTSAVALKQMYSYSPESEYVLLCYQKAVTLLESELINARSVQECKSLLDLFPKRSKEWTKIVAKIATFYPKPWYMFWA